MVSLSLVLTQEDTGWDQSLRFRRVSQNAQREELWFQEGLRKKGREDERAVFKHMKGCPVEEKQEPLVTVPQGRVGPVGKSYEGERNYLCFRADPLKY